MQLWLAWVGYLATSGAILLSGFRLCRETDALASRRGWTRSWAGLVLLATITSIPELLTGVSSVVLANTPRIAFGDVVGSLAFNLLILGGLAVVGRRHIFQLASPHHLPAVVYAGLLTAYALACTVAAPQLPASLGGAALLALLAAYLAVMWDLHRRGLAPSQGDGQPHGSMGLLLLNAAILIVAAAALPYVGAAIADGSGLGRTFVGGAFVAVSTSLPEVAVTLAAWRIGAPDLAIGNLVGSNLFDLAILGIDEALYPGSLLVVAEPGHLSLLGAALVMTGLLWLGLRWPRQVSGRLVGAIILALFLGAQAISYLG